MHTQIVYNLFAGPVRIVKTNHVTATVDELGCECFVRLLSL